MLDGMAQFPNQSGPIGVFDSGYGGLTILSEIRKRLPEYDYLYYIPLGLPDLKDLLSSSGELKD